MRLIIRKDQEDMKGLLGGHKGVKFTLTAHVDLTEGERALSERYKLFDGVLPPDLTVRMRGNRGPTGFKALLSPVYFECDNFTILEEVEAMLKSQCAGKAGYLHYAKSFGGDEVFEF